MTSSNSSSNSNRSSENSGSRDSGTGSPISPWLGALLGEVISQTDQLFETEQSGPDAHPEALRKVAERHRGEVLSVDPVIVELVEAVISDLASRISREDLRQRLVRHVADSLSEDPAAYKRVSSLWNNLQRSLP